MRFALEVAETVRAVWPADRPLWFRVSAVEGPGGVWGIEETLALSRSLKERGIDAIDCSSGGVGGDGTLPPVPRVPGFQAGYSSEIRQSTGLPTVAVGMIREPQHAEDLLQQGHADFIALARGLMDNPNWPLHAARTMGVSDPLALVHPREAQRLRQLVIINSPHPGPFLRALQSLLKFAPFKRRTHPMARTIQCIKLGQEAEGLDFPPYPGDLGKRIWESVSKQAWADWLKHQTMLVNENRLNLADLRARQYLARQMENHFFGDGADAAQGYVPPSA